LLLEFVGLPGAGKTTVAARLVSCLRARGITCADRRTGGNPRDAFRRLRRAAFLVRNANLAFSSLRFAASVWPVSLARLTHAARLAGWARQLRVYAGSEVDVVVLDQGPVQDAWSMTVPGELWDDAALRVAVRRLVESTNIPRAYVYVSVDADTAVDRLRQRRGSSSRFDRLSDADARRWLVRYEDSLSSIFQYAVAVANAPFLRLDGTLPVEEQCQQLADFVDITRRDSAEQLIPVATAAEIDS
jgi:thymidylate kinase